MALSLCNFPETQGEEPSVTIALSMIVLSVPEEASGVSFAVVV
jgi:hypothetical protein